MKEPCNIRVCITAVRIAGNFRKVTSTFTRTQGHKDGAYTAHQLSNVAVLFHHGGDSNGPLCTQSIVAQVQVSHIGVRLQ